MAKERATFSLLWQMAKEISQHGATATGTIIGRYAGIIDDRINNSGHSRSVDSLKLYSDQQLKDELARRKES